MAVAGSFQFSWESGIRKDHGCNKRFKGIVGRDELHVLSAALSSHASRQNVWSIHISDRVYRPLHSAPCRCNVFKCHSFLLPGKALKISSLKPSLMELTRSYNALQGSPLVIKLVPAIGIIIFAVWGLGPLLRQGRKFLLHKNDSSWGKSGTYHILTSYLQPLLLWTGALLICRAFDPVVPPSEAGQAVKQRLLTFVRSLSTVLAFAYCLSSVIQQAQSFFMETNGTSDTRNMGFQFAGKAVYSAVWVAAASLFMELLGFSTQRWLTAGGLGTVLLTLAGREIFTNFLSSAMIHATRPFVLNEWIQTKIEGYEVSGTVEHIGWWSPTVIRGDDREAVHIPNHKFTVNVVRNLSQKTHWRIKTHLAISHLDVSKINNIVADMRKVLAKNPQVEQQRLHRRVFLDAINPGNQALLILVSCFVKTSRFEEYLCVKEAILLDLLKVISHHQARLATPIRTVQKIHNEIDLENVPFADTIFTHGPGAGTAPNRPLLLIEPPYKIHGEEKTKTHPTRASTDSAGKSTPEPKSDPKVKLTSQSIPSIDGRDADISSTDSKVQTSVSDGKQIKKPGLGNTKQNVEIDSQVSVLETGSEKPTSSSNSSQSIQEVEKPPVVQPPAPRASLEENIVLGVALDGSKRTLPIEEEMEPPPSATEAKELATSRNGNGPPAAENDKKGQTPSPRAKSGG